MNAHLSKTLIVRVPGKEYKISAGHNREIPDEISDHWYIKEHIDRGEVIPVESKAPVAEQLESFTPEAQAAPAPKKHQRGRR